MRKREKIILLTIMVILVGILVGIFFHKKGKTSNLQQEPETTLAKNEEIKSNEIQTITTSTIELTTSPNTLYVFQTYYQECGHTLVKKVNVPQEEVNKTEEDLQEKYKDWGIKKFTSEQVIFYQEQEGICNEHYVLKEENGYVAIYTIDADDKEILKERTEIVTNYLPQTDQEQLKEGIKVNGQENLNATLEDYE